MADHRNRLSLGRGLGGLGGGWDLGEVLMTDHVGENLFQDERISGTGTREIELRMSLPEENPQPQRKRKIVMQFAGGQDGEILILLDEGLQRAARNHSRVFQLLLKGCSLIGSRPLPTGRSSLLH